MSPLQIMRNTPAQYLVTVMLPAGVTLSGKSLRFTVKTTVALPDTTNLFQKTSPAGGIVITGDLTATISVNAADTVSLGNKASQELVYDLWLVDGGNEYPLAAAPFEVVGDNRLAILT